MKIAIMMRAIDQDTGHRVFIENVVNTLLRIDSQNGYLLLYRTPKFFGRFKEYENAEEVLIRVRHKVLWDQVAAPYAAWKRQADIIFNPKFSVPLISHCPVAMGLHEPAWWARPEHHAWWDVLYMRIALPIYCRKSVHFFPWTQFVLDESRKYLRLPLENATVTQAAPSRTFRILSREDGELHAFRTKYGLPERFLLGVTRVENLGNKGVTFTDTKNVQTVVRAYMLCRDRIQHKLVIAGRHVKEYLLHKGWTESSLAGVQFLGFLPQEDLVKLYNLADVFVLPSYYEGFGLTQIEAMACGCPVITSKTGASPETTAGAAMLADPNDPTDVAEKILAVLGDETVRRQMRQKSLERAQSLSWERTARRVLEGLTKAASGRYGVLAKTSGLAKSEKAASHSR